MTGSLRVIRAADCRTMSWKNGGGSTTEIAVGPDGAGLGDFDWRVSIASVATDGPFSTFPGIDRTLTVLEGAGIALRVADRATVVLTPESPPHAFPGDAVAEADLLNGPITDLNVMTRRGRFDHRVTRDIVAAPVSLPGSLSLIHCRSGRGRLEADGVEALLAAGDSALVSAPGRFSPHGQAVIFAIALRPVQAGSK